MIEDFSKWLIGDNLDILSTRAADISLLKYPGTYEFTGDYERDDYTQNLSDEKVADKLSYYKDNPLAYKLNSDGFRTSDEFKDGGEVNIFLGCSNSFGYGMHQHHTWTHKLHNEISSTEKYWNLSVPGNGIDSDFRTLYYILKKYGKNIKVKNIFHYAPLYHRFEFHDVAGPIILSPNVLGAFEKTVFKNLLMEDVNMKKNYISSLNAIENISNEFNSNYYVNNLQYNVVADTLKPLHGYDIHNSPHLYLSTKNWNPKLRGLPARDLSHHGYLEHHRLFSLFLNMYNKNYKKRYL